MRLPTLVVIAALLVLPSTSFGFGTAVQTGHSLVCNLGLGASLANRAQAVEELMAADFQRIRAHNEQLRQMSDEEFKQYLSGEVISVAVCHPMSSGLVGSLPGTDYLAPLNRLTSVPGSLDRKVSYAIWAYSGLYRSLNKRIKEMQSSLHAFSPVGERQELDAAKRFAERLRNLKPEQVATGAGGEELASWLKQEGFAAGEDGAGPVRPTVPVYALQGLDLQMYEVNTVHLLFPSSVGPEQYCYERFAPDYPSFARLLTAGKADHIATTRLTTNEKAELLKFFNSAAKVQTEAFLLADLVGVALEDRADSSSLKSCLQLAAPEPTGSNNPSGWKDGTAVNFEADDKLWQTLISMLAAKRIAISNDL